jgi:type VI secretion system secreted protein VgrG
MSQADTVLPPVDYRFQTEAEGGPWLVREIDIDEELSGEFVAEIDLETDDALADPAALLGASATLTLSRPTPELVRRSWSGLVRAVREPCSVDLAARRRCQVRLEPALARLKDERLTRKFQGMTVPDVARAILGDLAQRSDREVELRLAREGEPQSSGRGFAIRDLCVQYDEVTFDFVRRILAEEGMTTFFEQGEQREKLVIVDANDGFDAAPEPFPLLPPGGRATASESIHHLALSYERPGRRAEVRAFNLTQHRPIVEARTREGDEAGAETYLAHPGVTFYGYDGGAYRRDDARVQASLALERSAAMATAGRGAADVIAFRPGLVFTIAPDELDPPPPAGKLLLVHVRHHGGNPERLGGADPAAPPYGNEFTFTPAEVPFRPPLMPKPMAVEDWAVVVSGLEGDPIDTDVHGRVRVRFGYDRDDAAPPERRSPFIPVAQAWAGDGYGVQIIPRAGMLVRLRYVHGDPDRPFVAGCLPTGTNVLPSPPPEEKTRLTIRTRSLRDAGSDLRHFNEITLDDAAHHEKVFIRAGRDYRRHVLNDEHVEIDRDEDRSVGRHQTLQVRGAREKTVGGDESILVMNKREAVVEGDDARTVHGNDTLVVDQDQIIAVGGTRTTVVDHLDNAKLNGGRAEWVRGNDNLHVTGKLTMIADQEWRAVQGPTELVMKDRYAQLRAGEAVTLEVAGARLELGADGTAVIACDKQISLLCGESSIVVCHDKIEVGAPEVRLSGTSGALALDRSGAATTGLNVSSTATGTNLVSGAFVKAN